MNAPPCRADMLDLRTWQWRAGAGLQYELSCRPDELGPLNMGVVKYDNKVITVGGR